MYFKTKNRCTSKSYKAFIKYFFSFKHWFIYTNNIKMCLNWLRGVQLCAFFRTEWMKLPPLLVLSYICLHIPSVYLAKQKETIPPLLSASITKAPLFLDNLNETSHSISWKLDYWPFLSKLIIMKLLPPWPFLFLAKLNETAASISWKLGYRPAHFITKLNETTVSISYKSWLVKSFSFLNLMKLLSLLAKKLG